MKCGGSWDGKGIGFLPNLKIVFVVCPFSLFTNESLVLAYSEFKKFLYFQSLKELVGFHNYIQVLNSI